MYGFRSSEQELEGLFEHTLTLTYAITLPDAPNATGFQWLDAPDGVYFDISLSDLNPGRYLESYMPANFPFDRYPVSLGVTVSGAGQEHVLFSNGDVEQLGDHEWQLRVPRFDDGDGAAGHALAEQRGDHRQRRARGGQRAEYPLHDLSPAPRPTSRSRCSRPTS